jgi:hypothetical protein
MIRYDLDRYWSDGTRIDIFAAAEKIHATRVVNDVGRLTYSIPFNERYLNSLEKGQMIGLWRNDRHQFQTYYTLLDWRATTDLRGLKKIEVYGECLNRLLKSRIVAYPAGSPQADKYGKPDNIIKEITRENLGADAPEERRIPNLTVEPNYDEGSRSINKSFAWRNALTVCQEISDMSLKDEVPIYFDLFSYDLMNLHFRTCAHMIGDDRRPFTGNPIFIGEQYGNLKNATTEWITSEEATVIYAGGQGEEADRVIKIAQDLDRIALSAPYGRIERFKDARNDENEDNIQKQAEEALNEAKPFVKVRGTLSETAGSKYDVHYNWGDFVTVESYGVSLDCMIKEVGLTYDANTGMESIDVKFEGVVT